MLDAIKDSFVLITSCFSSQSFKNPIFLITDCVYMDPVSRFGSYSGYGKPAYMDTDTDTHGYIPVYMMNISTLLSDYRILTLNRDCGNF